MTSDVFLHWATATADQFAPGVTGLVKLGEKVEIGKITLAPGVHLREHAHPEEQFFYLLSGHLRYRIGDVEDVAGPGDLVHMPCGVPHGGEVVGDAPAVFIEVKDRTAREASK